eukprot:Rmarinus@m.24078
MAALVGQRELDLGGVGSPPSNVEDARTLSATGFFLGHFRDDRNPPTTLESLTGFTRVDAPMLLRTDDDESRWMLAKFLRDRNRSALWRNALRSRTVPIFNNRGAAFSRSTHGLVNTLGSRVDVMFALANGGTQFPILIMEMMSDSDHALQVTKKLIGQLALLAELGWENGPFCVTPPTQGRNKGRKLPCHCSPPLSVAGLALPGYNAKRPVIEVTVEWDPEIFMYRVQYQKRLANDPNSLGDLVSGALEANRPVYQFLAARLQRIINAENLALRTLYRLSPSLLSDLQGALGVRDRGHLVQVRSHSGFVFALIEDRIPTLFFKCSPDLLKVLIAIFHLTNLRTALMGAVVLPVNTLNNAVGWHPLNVGNQTFFAFPSHVPFKHDDISRHLADVLQCLRIIHDLNCSHRDVRWENLVFVEKGVLFIDLDRMALNRLQPIPWPAGVWYPTNVIDASLDWYQLGVSLVRECRPRETTLENAVEAALSMQPEALIGDTRAHVAARTIFYLLTVQRDPINQVPGQTFDQVWPSDVEGIGTGVASLLQLDKFDKLIQ